MIIKTFYGSRKVISMYASLLHLRTVCRFVLVAIATFLMVPQAPVSAQNMSTFNDAELQQMLAPIALYPDTLLSQILIAASYPLDVVEAQRWTSNNPAVSGVDAVRGVDQASWDASVKSLVAFPLILQTMSANLEWTRRLGEAAVSQQSQVMNAVQVLRHRAYAAGNLTSGTQAQVTVSGNDIIISPVNPEILYVPYYNPMEVYGRWWWPQHPPRTFESTPLYGYSLGTGMHWGDAIFFDADYFFGKIFWVDRTIYVRPLNTHARDHYVRERDWGKWNHDDHIRINRPVSQPGMPANIATQTQSVTVHRDARDELPGQPNGAKKNGEVRNVSAVVPVPQIHEVQKAQTTITAPTQANSKLPENSHSHAHEKFEKCVTGPCPPEKDRGPERPATEKSR